MRRLPSIATTAALAFVVVFIVAPARGSASPEPALPSALASRSLLCDVARGGDRLWAVGAHGHVLVSADGGRSWNQVLVPTRVLLTAVRVDARDRIWVAGHDATILVSDDNGGTWTARHHAPELEAPLFDLWLGEDGRGLAVGAYGLLLGTTDGGETWAEQFLDPDEPHLYAVAEAPGGDLYLAGEFGSVYVSSDRGDTWERRAPPYEGTFFGVIPLGEDTILAYGLRGHLFRSPDRGASWIRVETAGEAGLYDAALASDGTLWFVGAAGTLLTSEDGGRSVTARTLSERVALAGVLEAEPGVAIAVGEAGVHRIPAVGEAAP